MPTLPEIIVGALGLMSSAFFGLLLWNVTRTLKSFDETSTKMQNQHNQLQKNQSAVLIAVTRQQEQIRTLFNRSIENRTRIVRLEDPRIRY